MVSIGAIQLNDYAIANHLEWIETDGVGGISACSVAGANTRKQHAVLSVDEGDGLRTVMVANLQESLQLHGRTYDLSTNAYFGAVSPKAHQHLESFVTTPWPTWQFQFSDCTVKRELFMVHGEHTVVVRYTLTADSSAMLTVRPLMAFRPDNVVCREHARVGQNWHVTSEFIECTPDTGGPSLYIAHPNARVQTIGLWYRGFLYERDRESHVDCIEDLYQPGYLEMPLVPGEPCALVFSTPSPRSIELVTAYQETELNRRAGVRQGIPNTDEFFQALLSSASGFVYDDSETATAILAGLPWGEAQTFHGLMAFSGVLLVGKRFAEARRYLHTMCNLWLATAHPSQFAKETVAGQIHAADVPLWLFVAAWRYWRATGDALFISDVILPVFTSIIDYHESNGEVRQTESGLIEVGYEAHANYRPVLPLGTNVLWYNALMTMAEFTAATDDGSARKWQQLARKVRENLVQVFQSDSRPGLANAVYLTPMNRDESIRLSQVLALGLPFSVLDDPHPTAQLIAEHLTTPYGPRTLSYADDRYVGNGSDVSKLPKIWSGSVDPMWFGLWCDAMRRVDFSVEREMFVPFELHLGSRGIGHISGAYAGNAPHGACDYVASSGAAGEVMRVYARDVLNLEHVI